MNIQLIKDTWRYVFIGIMLLSIWIHLIILPLTLHSIILPIDVLVGVMMVLSSFYGLRTYEKFKGKVKVKEGIITRGWRYVYIYSLLLILCIWLFSPFLLLSTSIVYPNTLIITILTTLSFNLSLNVAEHKLN